MDTPLVRAHGLTRVFGRGDDVVRAVDDVSFDLEEQEVVTVVGESGSGKSTLARLLLRLLDPTAGTLEVAGNDVTKLRRAALKAYWREVQAVFQDPFGSFNQFFTVRRLLDASLRANILNVLVDLRRDYNMTILFITHDIGQACYVSDRILVMCDGFLVEQGPTDDVIFTPRHGYTKALLADVPRLRRLS